MRTGKLFLGLACLLLSSCGNPSTPTSSISSSSTPASTSTPASGGESYPTTILNGGFESSNLSGWTIEYGDAFVDDGVSSETHFSFDDDKDHNLFEIGKEGNWYLSGKGFDNTFSHARTGAIRSSTFILTGDATISMKLAGGALNVDKGGNAAYKDLAQTCYVGVYLASNDRMIAMQQNEYFTEADPFDPNKYRNGVSSTDNFNEYTLYLDDYVNQAMYLRIVDNDRHHYYGYLSVDDIRIGGEDAQPEGAYYIKSHDYIQDIEAPSIHEIKNGGFETGSLAGWDVLEGLAFADEGVNAESTYWNENITYDRDDNYHYGYYRPNATGRMRSSTFILGGSGFVSFKLGGCMNNDLVYLSFYVLDSDGDAHEVARYSNRVFWDFQFPYVPNGLRLLNLNLYVGDLSEYLGRTMYIEVVDNDSSAERKECITLDSIQVYHEHKPEFYDLVHFEAISVITPEVIDESIYQVPNGSFETGDLTGWTTYPTNPALAIGEVTDQNTWWGEFPFNKRGYYVFSGEHFEDKTGYLQSSSFIVGGINKMSFLFGGGNDPRRIYISLIDAATDEELARYGNRFFHDIDTGLINQGSNLLNMVQYIADLSAFEGRSVYLRVVDNATNDWGLVAVDSFITYYADEAALPKNAYEALDLLKASPRPASEYQVANGDFETGTLDGWTKEGGNFANVGYDEVWWHEWYSFEKEGFYFFDGFKGAEEDTGSLTSSAFTVGGVNKMTFRLGGGKNTSLCYVSILDATTGDELARYGNTMFSDAMAQKYYYNGSPIVLSDDGIYMANMVQYVVDLSAFAGQSVKIRIVDYATNDWGRITADDFVTYYASEDDIPSTAVASTSLLSNN